jgi:quercetin dioxygenase-like cupin family protein
VTDLDHAPDSASAPARSEAGADARDAVRPLGDPLAIPTRPGMSRRSFIGPDDGVSELFVEELTFEQGAAIPLHQHPIVESFVVLVGELTFRLGDEILTVGPEHSVTIPPNTPHAVVNGEAQVARALTAAPWNHDTFFREVTSYLEGTPRD